MITKNTFLKKDANNSSPKEEMWWLTKMLIKVIITITVLLGLTGVAHFIYREIIIQNCGCNTIYETIDCQENDWECREKVQKSLKEAEAECRREQIQCPFLFNCKC